MLKGTTRIELTDVNTGEVEVIEKHNLVTNAIPDLLQLNPDGYLFDGSYALSDNLLPICPNAIGGILLYGEPLEENPAKYYAPESNPLIGYSSNNVNSTTDVKRGSLNLNESGQLDDGTGYRFVFDFDTSQGNGNIASLGLTSKWGGKAGYGSSLDGGTPVIQLSARGYSYSAPSTYAGSSVAAWQNVIAHDEVEGVSYFAYVSNLNEITVGKIRVNVLGMLTETGPAAGNIMEQKTFSTAAFAGVASTGNYYYYYTMLDGGDGYIWGFEHTNNAQGNSSGDAVINWIKIAKADWSVSEGQWTVGAQLFRFGLRQRNANISLANNYAIIHKGYLYCVNYAQTAIIRIKLDNPSDVTVIDDPNNNILIADPGSAYRAVSEFNICGDVLYYPGAYIADGKAYPVKTERITSNDGPTISSVTPLALKGCSAPGLRIGPYLLTYGSYKSSASSAPTLTRYIHLMTPYLATINNLETPVTKTADKTMKITYILREE